MINSLTDISTQLGPMFKCQVQDDRLRIVTPFVYPDGDNIDVFVFMDEKYPNFTVTDLGENIRWLRSVDILIQTNNPIFDTVRDIWNVDYHQGKFKLTCDSSYVLQAITRIIQVSIQFTYMLERENSNG